MAFQSHTDLFTEHAPIHPGQQRQIVMERFGNMQIDITVCTWPSEQYATTVQDQVAVEDCNRKSSGLQSARFWDHIICNYGRGQDRIN
jgi:hypothetical protein